MSKFCAVILVTTASAPLGNTGRMTGLSLEELAGPDEVFQGRKRRHHVRVAKGGRLLLDPGIRQVPYPRYRLGDKLRSHVN